MNTKNSNLRIEELETQIEQAENRKARADTRQQEANDQRDIDNLRAQIKELIEKIKMSDVKMSDEFDGKVDAVESLNLGDSWELADCIEHSGACCIADSKSQMKAAAMAINAYDANQERIKMQQQTNAELADVVAKMLVSNNEQKEEIKALEAQVKLLHESLSKNQEWVRCGIGGNCGGYPQDHRDYKEITNLLNKTRAQCIADVRADAEKKGYWQGFETGTIWPGENILSHYNSWLELKALNERHAQQLRDNAK